MSEQPPIRRTAERLRFENEFIRVYDDEVEFLTGRTGSYVRITSRTSGRGVVLVATHDDEYALVRTYRYPLRSWEWAFPRGFAHSQDSLESARAELFEELGVTDAEFQLVGSVAADSGLLDTVVDVYLVRLADRPDGATDSEEVHGVQWLSHEEITQLVASDELREGYTLSALTLATSKGMIATRRSGSE